MSALIPNLPILLFNFNSRRVVVPSTKLITISPRSPFPISTSALRPAPHTIAQLPFTEMSSNGFAQGAPDDLSLSSSYEAAMEALSSLITRRKRGDGSSRGSKFDLMFKYLEILGLEERLSSLRIIHVAGTKGKGSTCTFSEAILKECGFRTGLFTSPHLIDVRERYRINGINISEESFLLYFWDCWNQLKAKAVADLPMPPLFQFLSLLAFKIFLSEKVDVAIIEVGLGGRLDSTNVVKEPVVCGITSLGMDHTEILGDTIEKIASEKAGIFKRNIPAFTVPQLSEAMFVLAEKASELMVPLAVASPLSSEMLNGANLGLAGDHQFVNAGLALELCKCWLQRTGHQSFLPNDVIYCKHDRSPGPLAPARSTMALIQQHEGKMEEGLPIAFLRGLSTATLPGRAQIVHEKLDKSCKKSEVNENSGDLIFYLDSAHSPESMEVCARWFSNVVRDDQLSLEHDVGGPHCNAQTVNNHCNGSNRISKRILLFNCMEVRDPQLLLPPLVNTCSSRGVHFSKALFVPGMSTYHRVNSGVSAVPSDISQDLSWQLTLQRTWEKIIHGKDAIVDSSSKIENPMRLPSTGFLSEDSSQKCYPSENYASSIVIPSLPLTIKWLRDSVKDNPSLRLQVLVTGSLHLVGDVLKLLRR